MEMMNSSGAGGGGAAMGYADSVDSSPRSRGGESWDEPFPSLSSVAGSKLRLMCSYGGRIVPRPTDRSLCYLGGDTRIVVVERNTTLTDLSGKLSRNLLGGRNFTLKYQLPNEDLDSLISVTTDEDLDNMIDEYDRLVASSSAGGGSGSSRSSRLRVFLFPTKSDSTPSSIGSLLDDSKSETWFVDALNGGVGMDGLPRGLSSDSASVNCLLGLEDDSSVKSRSGISPSAAASAGIGPAEHERMVLPRPESSGKLARHGVDVQSVPDSPMVENTSSFGSASSAPYLSNLPPIRLRPDDRPQESQIVSLEEHLSQMNIASAAMAAVAAPAQRFSDEGGIKDTDFPFHNPPLPNPIPTSAISPTENPNRKTVGGSSDEEKTDQVSINMPPPVQQQPPPPLQHRFNPLDSALLEPIPRPIYYQERVSASTAGVNPITDSQREVSVPNYVLASMAPPEQQFRQHPSQTHQLQQQPQFISSNPNPQYYQHPATGNVFPFPSYYQMPIQQSQQSHHFDPQQFPVYYLPVRQNPAPPQPQPYRIPLTPSLSDVSPQGMPATAFSNSMAAKQELPANMYRMSAMAPPAPTSASGLQAPMPPPQQPLIHIASDQGHPYSGMSYHVMHHNHPSQPQPTAATASYGYEFATDQSGNPQVYFTQTTSPAGIMPQQYQTVVTSPDAAAAAAAATTLLSGEVNKTRAS
ncbi:hypothetical protein KSP40_PGU001704 [Platanthera guangdongensis]|uniref:PB1 domain-containing protein n=1 Tax=Platanthera guangdongensis TaxID=2320717 RepID=A0ABR2MAA9_9ASPA